MSSPKQIKTKTNSQQLFNRYAGIGYIFIRKLKWLTDEDRSQIDCASGKHLHHRIMAATFRMIHTK